MFGFGSPTKKVSSRPARRLSLESLEARDCPSAFTATQILPVDLYCAYAKQQSNGAVGSLVVTETHTYGTGHIVNVSGSVSGPGAGGSLVEIDGPIEGLVTTNADGSFSFSAPAKYLGNLMIGAVSSSLVSSNVVQDAVADVAPTIVSFTYTKLNNSTYQFTVQVNYQAPAAGLVVSFGGAPQMLQNETAVVQPNGSLYTATLTIDSTNGVADTGTATAQIVSDWWGLSSNLASVEVS
jgi:hypothetical protein